MCQRGHLSNANMYNDIIIIKFSIFHVKTDKICQSKPFKKDLRDKPVKKRLSITMLENNLFQIYKML